MVDDKKPGEIKSAGNSIVPDREDAVIEEELMGLAAREEVKKASIEKEKVMDNKNGKGKDAFLKALDAKLIEMEASGEISPEQAEGKRKAAILIEVGFSDNPKHDALIFSKAGIAGEKETMGILNNTSENSQGESVRTAEVASASAKRSEIKDPKEASASETDKLNEAKKTASPSFSPRHVEGEAPQKTRENLESELEAARKTYAGEHYKATKEIKFLDRILGLRRTSVDDKDTVRSAYSKYKDVMNSLLNSQIDELKMRKEGGSINDEAVNKEMVGLIKYYNLSEKTNLFEARTNAKAEAQRGKILPIFAKGAAATVNWYRKLDWKWKVGFGLALFATGGVGLVSATSIAGISLFSRSLASGSLGTGIMVGKEASYRRKEKKASEENIKETMLALEEEGGDKFTKLQEILGGKVDEIDRALSKELKSAKNRKLLGLGVGAAVFLLPSLIKWGLQSGLTEHALDTGGVTESGGSAVKEVAEAVTGGATEEVAHHATELTIEKGSSVEGTLIKQLMSEGISKGEAGSMAHRMAAEYAKSHNLGEKGMFSLVQPGTHIEYDSATHKILGVSSENRMDWLDGHSHDTSHLGGGVSGDVEPPQASAPEPKIDGPLSLGETPDSDMGYDVYNEWQSGQQKDIKEFGRLFQKAEALKMEKQSFLDTPYKLDPTDQDSMRRFEEVRRGIPTADFFFSKSKAVAKVVRSIFEGNSLGIKNLADAGKVSAAGFLGNTSDVSVLRIGALANNLNMTPAGGEKLDKFIGRLMIALAKQNK